MWWWGPCAGSTCCADVTVPQRADAATLYDELVPLQTDGRRTMETDDDSDADASTDAASALRASISGIAVEPGIYRARDLRTHDAVALKVFDKVLLKNKATRRRLRKEIRILSQCGQHPNILRLYGVYASKRTFQIAFELARGGEVMHRIAASAASRPSPYTHFQPLDVDMDMVQTPPQYRVTEREIARVIAGAASAIQFMHARGLVHGEVRPEHLLYSDFEPDARVLLVDFGRAAAWYDLTFRSRVHRGRTFLWHDRHSLKFLPPAVVQRCPLDGVPDWDHARQVDIWSLGVTMFVLLCGAFPFDGLSLADIRQQIVHHKLAFPRRPSSHQNDGDVRLSRAARDLLGKLLEKDPYAAPSIDDVCAHPWLSADVAPDVRWSDAQIGDFGGFAQSYQRAVAASSLRRPTLGDRENMGMGSSSSSSRRLRDSNGSSQVSPMPYDVYGVPTSSGGQLHQDEDTFDGDAERPSFVSTEGNIQVSDASERLSADAYMRLASDELEAFTAQKAAAAESPSPRRSIVVDDTPQQEQTRQASTEIALEEDRAHQPPTIKGDFWPLFSRQRRLFSFKSLSFRSGSSGSKDDDR